MKPTPLRPGHVFVPGLASARMIPILAVASLALLACSEADGLRVLAYFGYAAAQNNLGLMYAEGDGVPEDDAEAVKWYRKAADQGEAVAQNNLGVMYANGEGVPEDDTEAVKWFRKAADQGDAGAQFNLGVRYASGNGVPKDAAEAVKWFRKAADQGEATALFSLGVLYSAGEGVPKDHVSAYKWFNLAAAAGDEKAQRRLKNLGGLMQKEQIAEAQRLAREWHEGHSIQSEGTP